MSQYITPQGEHAIRTFRYKGSNLSHSYNLLWSPLADQILKIVPLSWAPNTITVVGLLIHVVTTIVLVNQGEFGSDAPAWALGLHGVGLFLYQTLDNVDGKQARRLQNSTPLGMIMDHGCDALGLGCLSVGMARIICLDDPQLILLVFTFGVTFGFYISAWCQYFSDGLMVLGPVNAVDDGIPIIWISAFWSAIFGQGVWRTPISIFGVTYGLNAVIASSIVVAGIVQVYSIIASSGDNFTKDIKRAGIDLIHLGMIGSAVGVITVYSGFAEEYFAQLIIGIGFTMARTISYTLLCSVTGAKFEQFHPSVLLFGLGYPFYIFFGGGIVAPSVFVNVVTGLIVAEYIHFVVTVCLHIAGVLNISVFHVFGQGQLRRESEERVKRKKQEQEYEEGEKCIEKDE